MSFLSTPCQMPKSCPICQQSHDCHPFLPISSVSSEQAPAWFVLVLSPAGSWPHRGVRECCILSSGPVASAAPSVREQRALSWEPCMGRQVERGPEVGSCPPRDSRSFT